jgi:hypothetical protein
MWDNAGYLQYKVRLQHVVISLSIQAYFSTFFFFFFFFFKNKYVDVHGYINGHRWVTSYSHDAIDHCQGFSMEGRGGG